MKKLIHILISLMLYSSAMHLYAHEVEGSATDVRYGGYERALSGYRPSYFVIANENGNDEAHAEFSLSIKYPLFGGDGNSTLFFAYTGDYDFYLFSRESSPVISRRQNPGLFYRYNWLSGSDQTVNAISIGWFHESNGQTIETREEYDATENAADYVSRGWDYLALGIESQLFGVNSSLFVEAQLNIYCDCQAFGAMDSREDDIFWKDVDEQPNVNDYNGINFNVFYTIEKDTRFSVSLRAGNRDSDAVQNISYRVDAVLPVFSLPVKFFYFNGYGVNIATYHERGSYYGIGVDFW